MIDPNGGDGSLLRGITTDGGPSIEAQREDAAWQRAEELSRAFESELAKLQAQHRSELAAAERTVAELKAENTVLARERDRAYQEVAELKASPGYRAQVRLQAASRQAGLGYSGLQRRDHSAMVRSALAPYVKKARENPEIRRRVRSLKPILEEIRKKVG